MCVGMCVCVRAHVCVLCMDSVYLCERERVRYVCVRACAFAWVGACMRVCVCVYLLGERERECVSGCCACIVCICVKKRVSEYVCVHGCGCVHLCVCEKHD